MWCDIPMCPTFGRWLSGHRLSQRISLLPCVVVMEILFYDTSGCITHLCDRIHTWRSWSGIARRSISFDVLLYETFPRENDMIKLLEINSLRFLIYNIFFLFTFLLSYLLFPEADFDIYIYIYTRVTMKNDAKFYKSYNLFRFDSMMKLFASRKNQ